MPTLFRDPDIYPLLHHGPGNSEVNTTCLMSEVLYAMLCLVRGSSSGRVLAAHTPLIVGLQSLLAGGCEVYGKRLNINMKDAHNSM